MWIREVAFKDHVFAYSYYWLRSDNSIIIGWDNAPHHQEIETFPHHKHIGKNVESSQETSLDQVLTYIVPERKPPKIKRILGKFSTANSMFKL